MPAQSFVHASEPARARLIRLSQLPLFGELLFEFLDGREEVAHFFDAGESFVGAELEEVGFFLFQAVCDFIPCDGRGNGRLFFGAE